MKILFHFFLLFLHFSFLTGQEYPSQITDFFKCLFIDSESGYVFFGSKPVCYYGCTNSSDSFLIGTSTYELEAKLRVGIQWWESAQPTPSNDNFVLKIKRHGDKYEILSLNKQRILQTVEDNLSLFRYILGPKVTPINLFEALAKGDEPFYKLLNYDNTLVGILLGFGTENSILHARSETLFEFQLDRPEIPYAQLSNHSLEEAINYLELTLLFDDNFKRTSGSRWKKSLGINSIEEEVEFIQNLQEPSSHLLSTYSPRFIFGGFQLQKNNNELLDTLENEQQRVIELLRSDEFTYQVLKRLNIDFIKPQPNIKIEPLSATVMAEAIKKSAHLRLFDDLEGVCEGIQDANLYLKDRYQEPDFELFYELLLFEKLQKSFLATETYFKDLRQNSTFTKIDEHVHIKNKKTMNDPSSETLQNDRSIVTVSYAAYLPLENEELPVKAASHSTINLNEVIQGLAIGLQGMKTGELREIHVSPDAAYGFLADFQTSGPIKFLVCLESIEDSPPLVLSRQPVNLERSKLFSAERKDSLNQLKKALSYKLGKTFWMFYQENASFSGNQLIEQLKVVWDQSQQKILDNPLDYATLAFSAKQHQQGKQRAQQEVKQRSKAQKLIENLLYVEYEKQGQESSPWQKSISLVFKDMDGKILKKTVIEKLTQKEYARLCKGLQVGLKCAHEGDKGTFLIDPDFTDQGLFHNKLYHQALLVEFEVHDN